MSYAKLLYLPSFPTANIEHLLLIVGSVKTKHVSIVSIYYVNHFVSQDNTIMLTQEATPGDGRRSGIPQNMNTLHFVWTGQNSVTTFHTQNITRITKTTDHPSLAMNEYLIKIFEWSWSIFDKYSTVQHRKMKHQIFISCNTHTWVKWVIL